MKLINTIVARNTFVDGFSDIDGDFTAPAPNIVMRHSFGAVDGIQPISTDPFLGLLDNNGGPTWTMLISKRPTAIWGRQAVKNKS